MQFSSINTITAFSNMQAAMKSKKAACPPRAPASAHAPPPPPTLHGKEFAVRRLGSAALTTLLAAQGRAVDEGGRI